MLKLDEMQARANHAIGDYGDTAVISLRAADVLALLADRERIRAVVLDERSIAVSAGRTDVVTYLDSVLRRMDE